MSRWQVKLCDPLLSRAISERFSNKALKCVRKRNKVFAKYKDRTHPAVQKANSKAKAALKKARRLFGKKLASDIKCDKKSFYAYARSKAKSKLQISSVLDDKGNHVLADR